MATFTSSRLGNLREKKSSGLELPEEGYSANTNLKLTMPEEGEKSTYDPTTSFSNTRTSMRMLKGRIQRKESSQKNSEIASNNVLSDKKINGTEQPPKLFLNINETKEDLKLVIHDSPQISSKKFVSQLPEPSQKKRILIAKEPQKEQVKQVEVKQQKQTVQVVNKIEEMPVGKNQKVPINEQQVEQSTDQVQNENELIECPEGCGRKFNRKALEKHQKACKLVFMSKRKEFNSEAKRVTSKEQAQIVKQNKLKQKKQQLGKNKGKGFDKTSDNWKAASQDFRAVLKARKKEEGEKQEGEEGQEEQEQKDVKMVNCQYCEKLFNQVFIDKHLQNCLKKKEAEKKIVKKKK